MARDEKLIERVNKYVNHPRARTLLDAVSGWEGTANRGSNGYNIRFGGAVIDDLSKHPRIYQEYTTKTGKKEKSAAAGRYQFLPSTWDNIAGKLGLPDFSADSQDKAALGLILSIPGAEKAMLDGDVAQLAKLLNSTWTSVTGSVEGGKRHAVRPFESVLGIYNQAAIKNGLPASKATWDGTEYSNVAPPRGTAGRQVQFQSPFSRYYNSYGNSTGRSFLREALSGIYNRSYASAGDVPLEVTSNGTSSSSANPDITDPENVAILRQRLLAPNPNERYGLSFVGSGLRPTITRTDNVTGQDHSVIEMGKGVYVDAATGQRVNYDGSAYEGAPVEVPQAEYLAPGETPVETPEVITADPATELQAASTEAALASNTPLTNTASVASVDPVVVQEVVPLATPAQQVELLTKTLGGDQVTRSLNGMSTPNDLARRLIQVV